MVYMLATSVLHFVLLLCLDQAPSQRYSTRSCSMLYGMTQPIRALWHVLLAAVHAAAHLLRAVASAVFHPKQAYQAVSAALIQLHAVCAYLPVLWGRLHGTSPSEALQARRHAVSGAGFSDNVPSRHAAMDRHPAGSGHPAAATPLTGELGQPHLIHMSQPQHCLDHQHRREDQDQDQQQQPKYPEHEDEAGSVELMPLVSQHSQQDTRPVVLAVEGLTKVCLA